VSPRSDEGLRPPEIPAKRPNLATHGYVDSFHFRVFTHLSQNILLPRTRRMPQQVTIFPQTAKPCVNTTISTFGIRSGDT